MVDRLSNWKLAAIAGWKLGGATKRVDTEDIAEQCWLWAPERFGWKRHSFPDIRIAGEALRDAKKTKNGGLMEGEEKDGGWLLTSAGVEWIRRNQSLVDSFIASPGRSALPRQQDSLLQALAAHIVFQSWKDERSVRRSDIADALDLTADAASSSIRQRLTTVCNAASLAADETLKEFTEWLRETFEKLES